ncbi:MAG: nucleoside triphosphate pyrophosphohydrolase [Sphingobium sp.]|nr:nucleoside triphosphate pyrophosphohydrolase [Sphingobium sp.]MBP6112363.1 nucleoside triphosphate pyrophosphohydrolase [Sphingobium sp.]MBP8671820.1 nucleoside triphosphate pyrophosphohydrolase [Sphingobium sp.]MBP9156159.1 nucleoside triphosphate pyrophosphohydrolase [Sphingobium sp.]MCC6481839.1 nucleoside triphosphate pyrophosphohydrolase [Sphingomonadaceae bacterium]
MASHSADDEAARANSHHASGPPIDIAPLTDIMARLRDPATGCPWDRQQSFATIAPYTIEEAYEVADAIARNDMPALRDELGDLLLQVVYHARMAEESAHFSLKDVISAICDKMIRRHPHVFGPEGAATPGWEAIKAEERAGHSTDDSALSGVATALPALLRAEKLQNRAARTGFDWPDTDGVYAKIDEELAEVRAAETQAHRAEEIGDLLFAVVNLARHMKLDAEEALRKANAKFENRFRSMELKSAQQNIDFTSLSLEEKEALWQVVKAEHRA